MLVRITRSIHFLIFEFVNKIKKQILRVFRYITQTFPTSIIADIRLPVTPTFQHICHVSSINPREFLPLRYFRDP